MNDLQILTLALTVAVPFFGVMLGVLINNTRLNDVKEVLRGEVLAGGAQVRLEVSEVRSELHLQIADIQGLIERHHSEMMSKLMEMDNRLLRLEAQRLVQ